MKILQVLDSYPPDLNGGAYFTHRLSRQLVAMGHQVLVICPSRSLKSHYDSYEGVPLFRVRSYPSVLYRNFRVCWPIGIGECIKDAVDRFAPDVVHLQGRFILGNIVMQHARDKKLPMVATNHFMPENFFHYTRLPRWAELYFSRAAWKWVKTMFDLAAVWTTPTASAAALLRKNGFREKHIHAISCGVDLARFHPRTRNATAKLPLPPDALPTVLYAGRLDKEKNIPLVFQAMQKVTKTLPCRLVLVGTGAEENDLRLLARQMNIEDSIHFMGYVTDEDYPLVFSLADCFIHAGTAELQSIVTLEAIASGLPVVAARAMALPELVRDDENGYLFTAGDAGQAADCLLRILENPDRVRSMREASLAVASAHNAVTTATSFLELYQEARTHGNIASSAAP